MYMTNTWMGNLANIRVILFDYSALLEAGNYHAFESITEDIFERRILVVISSSFNYYHTCTVRAENAKETMLLTQIQEFITRLSHEQLLVPDTASLSMLSILPRYADRSDACLFVSGNSSIMGQIRSAKLKGLLSVGSFNKEKFVYYRNLDELIHNESLIVNPVSTSTDYLDVTTYVNIGDKVYTDNGEHVVLSEKISTGSEGLVFRTDDPRTVAKIYHRGLLTALRWMKLTRMTKMGLRAKGICWPISLLYNGNREPVGYLMPVAEGSTLGSVFDGPDAILDRFPEWDRNNIVQAACQIFEKIIYLHLHGILIGDIQLKNIMIKSAKEVYLIDMDSVQLEDLPCPVGTEEFTPPELWDRSFSTFLRSSLHEDYSCGILAFTLIFCGQHPYNQRLGKETLREEIASLAFPYKCGEESNSGIPLGGYDKIWNSIPSNLQNMFCKAFSMGNTYETVEWYAALSAYKDQLSSKSFSDPEVYLLFPNTRRSLEQNEDVHARPKRSIRDAIIHVPESRGSSPAASERVIYNGRAVSTAFVSLDKLKELDLERIKKQAAEEKAAISPAVSGPVTLPPAVLPVKKETPVKLADSPTDSAVSKNSKNSKKSSSRKKNRHVTLFTLFIIVFAVLGVLIYNTYFK